MAILKNEEQLFNLSLDESGKAYLLQTVRWTKFLAIFGFIIVGLMMIGGISMVLFSSAFGSQMYGVLPGYMISIIYVVVAAIYVYPIYCLYKFSVLIKPAIYANNQLQFNNALRFQRNMFKFLGIFTILFLALYAILIVFFIVTSAMSI